MEEPCTLPTNSRCGERPLWELRENIQLAHLKIPRFLFPSRSPGICKFARCATIIVRSTCLFHSCVVCYHHCTLYMSFPLLRGVLPSLYALHVYSTRLQMQKAKWRRGGDITCIFNDQPKPRNATGTKPPIILRVGDPAGENKPSAFTS